MAGKALQSRRFLVVEDDPYSRKIVEKLLRESGAADVYFAGDGIEAVARAAAIGTMIDGIVSDLNMKPMHGLYLLQAVRAGVVGLARETPTVIVTGNANDTLLRHALELDCNGFISKPVSHEKLERRVARALVERFPLKEARHYAAIKLPSRIVATEYIKINGIDFPVYKGGSPKTIPEETAVAEIPRAFPSSRAIKLSEAEPGAMITKEVCTGDGMLLLAPGVELTNLIISRLKDLAEMDPAVETIWID